MAKKKKKSKKKKSALLSGKAKKKTFKRKKKRHLKKKVTTRKVKKTKSSSKKKKTKKKARRSGYQRGDLGRAIFKLFDNVGVDKVTFKQALKVAKKAKPDTTYETAYFSWHKNHYKNERDL